MAVEHLVLLKAKENPPELEALCREWETSLEKIPGIVTLSMGANFRSGASGFTHALVIRFQDRKALDGFMTHPDHIAVGKRMQGLFSEFLILDYETQRS